MQQNDERPLAGLDVVQPHVADVGVPFADVAAQEFCRLHFLGVAHSAAHDDSPLLPTSLVGYPKGSRRCGSISSAESSRIEVHAATVQTTCVRATTDRGWRAIV